MSEPADPSSDVVNEPEAESTASPQEDPFAYSATPLKGRKKGFPVMPNSHNMLGMYSEPRPSARERGRPRNGPPIDDWEAVLVGKRYIKEDAEDEENTFKKSDLPDDTRFLPGPMMHRAIIGRLNVWLDADKVVTKVFYG